MLTKDDRREIESRGITEQDIEQQIIRFREGFPYLQLIRPATPGDGILMPGEDTLDDYVRLYGSLTGNEKIFKFVPSSGAATRMFKELSAALEKEDDEFVKNDAVRKFISGLPGFAFYKDLNIYLEKTGHGIDFLVRSGDYKRIISGLLESKGMNYAGMPKGLLAFHKYGEVTRTPIEEHLVEGVMYCAAGLDMVNIHFTVSPEHLESFNNLLNKLKKSLEDRYGVRFNVEFSVQDPSTDTIAVDQNDKPFRDSNGKLVFRPGGHGALLNNLDSLEADIIFIKNIDNVVPDYLKSETVRYKKALGGMLLSFRERIFYYLNFMENITDPEEGILEEIRIFLEKELCVTSPWGYADWNRQDKRAYLQSKLNRPLCLCGMVKNEGEPGGGPFWVKNRDGSAQLQIVESSQIDLSSSVMKRIFNASTHFNPVDLVCSLKDYKGNKFDLYKFRDPETGFISHKSLGGRELKALELPGLWNGAMADWNTVFVEVPVSTFNPVKTIFDLLRPQHSPE